MLWLGELASLSLDRAQEKLCSHYNTMRHNPWKGL
uniref:Uncharacterized protein n=1 Tax=Anguilla anguilla TaxID=7936 RepID=A0A0E9SJ88_ANGAN